MTDRIIPNTATEQPDALGALINSLNANDWQEAKAKPVTQTDSLQQKISLPAALPTGEADPAARSVVVVDEHAHLTHILQMKEGQLTDVLTVPDAVGKKSSPTPEKRWEVTDKRLDPIWHPPADIGGAPVAPFKVNPHNPIGLAFIRLDGSNYGLHGTNRPDQIGKSVSHGCMRHRNEDILKIYPLVDKGTAVYTVPNFEGASINLADFNSKSL
jgi:lipoprotein-anchoring transpeptidase ErfK/SrfK